MATFPSAFFEKRLADCVSNAVDALENTLNAAREPHAAALAALLRSGMHTDARAMAWERLHSERYYTVPVEFSEAYGTAELACSNEALAQGDIDTALRAVDMCLLMGGPQSRQVARKRAQQLMPLVQVDIDPGGESERERQQTLSLRCPSLRLGMTVGLAKRHAIKRISAPSISKFLNDHINPSIPVIITGAMNHWPAMSGERRWSNLNYLRRVAGPRLVPVEIGENYLHEDWSQQLLPLSDFIDRFVEGADASAPAHKGYLAQHKLFDQVEDLRRDVCIPDYCALARHDERNIDENENEDKDVVLNAWFGPSGTVSPLHYDPKHNLLAQVVGSKYICLFSPSDSASLYPDEGGLMPNNSRVDFTCPNLEKYPLYGNVTGMECELQAGEMLYIPPLFWHGVRSQSTSFSVSFWWGKKWSLNDGSLKSNTETNMGIPRQKRKRA